MSLHACRLVTLPRITDARGSLGFAEAGKHLPFEPKRAFWLCEVPEGKDRGAHAHKALHQFIIALNGSFEVVLKDGDGEAVHQLSGPSQGLYVAPMTWCEVKRFSPGAVCLVLCSAPYDEADYLRDWSGFLRAKGLAA